MARKTSFYYAFLVLPAEQRRAIIAVWDFCRVVDDAVDEAPSRESAEQAMIFWRAELARIYSAASASSPGALSEGAKAPAVEGPQTVEGIQLQPFVRQFDLPRQAFEDVIDGCVMDLDTQRYETFDHLLEYCHRVASAVGLICIKIWGCEHPDSRRYAVDLGVALQLTNILRDIKDDLEKGRVYIPQEDLRATGCRIEDLAAGKVTEPVRRLMELECGRAHDFYERARRARPDSDRWKLIAAEIMRAVYSETLRRIEQNHYDVFSRRTRVPKPRQALIALNQLLWPTQ